MKEKGSPRFDTHYEASPLRPPPTLRPVVDLHLLPLTLAPGRGYHPWSGVGKGVLGRAGRLEGWKAGRKGFLYSERAPTVPALPGALLTRRRSGPTRAPPASPPAGRAVLLRPSGTSTNNLGTPQFEGPGPLGHKRPSAGVG